jgi:serine/threonine-protein kinase
MIKLPSALFARIVFVAIMIGGVVISPTVAAAQDRYGAITFSESSGAHGWSYGLPTQRSAEQQALDKCASETDDCQAVIWFRNACGALAVGTGNAYGATWGSSPQAALDGAMSKCREQAEDCKPVKWICTGR